MTPTSFRATPTSFRVIWVIRVIQVIRVIRVIDGITWKCVCVRVCV